MKVTISEFPKSNLVEVCNMEKGKVYRFQEYLITRVFNDGVIAIDTASGNCVEVYPTYYELDEHIAGCNYVELTNLTASLLFSV